jgi:hypothetical protein
MNSERKIRCRVWGNGCFQVNLPLGHPEDWEFKFSNQIDARFAINHNNISGES